MQRLMILFTCFLLVPTITLAGDGPVVTVTGTGISPVESSDPLTTVPTIVDAGADIQYCWSAIAGATSSPVSSYRYGWDVVDPNDPFDPNWGIPATAFDGSETCAPTQSFLAGAHQFVVAVTDEAGTASTIVVQVDINQAVPVTLRSTGMLKARY